MKAGLFLNVALLAILAACGPAGPILAPGPPFDPLLGAVVLLALVFGGFWVLKYLALSRSGQGIERRTDGAGPRSTSRAEEILKERYARGEIDRQQYLDTMEDLKRR